MIRLLNTQEVDAVCGGNGVTEGGCIPPDLFGPLTPLPPPFPFPTLQDILGSVG